MDTREKGQYPCIRQTRLLVVHEMPGLLSELDSQVREMACEPLGPV